jgi:hypothetical protein
MDRPVAVACIEHKGIPLHDDRFRDRKWAAKYAKLVSIRRASSSIPLALVHTKEARRVTGQIVAKSRSTESIVSIPAVL